MTAAVSLNVRSGSGVYNYGTLSYEESDIRNSDDGSIEIRERNSAFRNGISTFPSDADDPQPMVVFKDKLFSDDVLADTSASVHEEVPVVALQVFTDEGVPLVPLVIDQDARRIRDVSVLPLPIFDPPIHSGTSDMGLSHGDTEWFCLLYSDGAASVDNGTMAMGLGGQGLRGSLVRSRLGPWYRGPSGLSGPGLSPGFAEQLPGN